MSTSNKTDNTITADTKHTVNRKEQAIDITVVLSLGKQLPGLSNH